MKTKQKKRRSNEKRMTKEARVLKYMREGRKLSMRRAAKVIGTSEAQINHAENGRKDLRPDFIMKVVSGYGYSYQDFLDLLSDKKEAPEQTLNECIAILKRLNSEKIENS